MSEQPLERQGFERIQSSRTVPLPGRSTALAMRQVLVLAVLSGLEMGWANAVLR